MRARPARLKARSVRGERIGGGLGQMLAPKPGRELRGELKAKLKKGEPDKTPTPA